MKKLITTIIASSFILFNCFEVNAASEYDKQLVEFLKTRPTLFYTKDEKDSFISKMLESNIQNYTIDDEIEFFDLNDDNFAEVFIKEKRQKAVITSVYTFVPEEGRFIFATKLEDDYKFYKNSKNETMILETGKSGVKYSYVTLEMNLLTKNTLYSDAEEYFTKIPLNGEKYDKDKIEKNPSILDKTLEEMKKKDKTDVLNNVKKEIEKEKKDISILINAEKLTTNIKPTIKNSRTLVPLRVLSNAFGADVHWDPKTKLITIDAYGDKIKLKIDKNYGYINDKKIDLDSAPILINDSTYVPLRFVAEAFNSKVSWIEKTKTVSIVFHAPNYIEAEDYDFIQSKNHTGKDEEKFSTIENFDDSNGTQYAEKFIVWSNETIKDFRIYEIEYKGGNELEFTEKKELFKLDVLKPDTAIIINTSVPEIIPNKKIIYTDSLNRKWESFISYDGRFGVRTLYPKIIRK